MDDLIYDGGNIILSANTLYFDKEQLNYNILENAFKDQNIIINNGIINKGSNNANKIKKVEHARK